MQLSLLLGLLSASENTLFVLAKRRNRKNHLGIIMALPHPSIAVVYLEKNIDKSSPFVNGKSLKDRHIKKFWNVRA